MKFRALISLLFILSAVRCEGTMHLYGDSDAYSQVVAYPGYGSPLSFAYFEAGNETTAVSPVLLRATIFRPEFGLSRYQNFSGIYHPIQPLWDQFTFYLPFIKENWKPAASDHVTPTMRQFMQEDGYREGVEQHNDPDRMGLNRFLDDDEPPGRPLL